MRINFFGEEDKVKKELETGNFIYAYQKIENQNNNQSFCDASNKVSTLLLIDKLKREVEQLNIRIESDYKDEFKLLKSYNEIDKIYKQLLLRIKIASKQITKLNSFNYIDKIIISLMVILSIILFLNFCSFDKKSSVPFKFLNSIFSSLI